MSVTLGPKLGVLINAATNEVYVDQFRPFLRFFDAMVLGNVINSTTINPPASPNNGDAYLLTGTPGGAWSGQGNAVAVWSTEITQLGSDTKIPGWEFWTPNEGWMIWDTTLHTLWIFTQGIWTQWTTIVGSGTAGSGGQHSGGRNENLVVVASSATTVFDYSVSSAQKTVINQATEISFANPTAGYSITVILTMDSVGGESITWDPSIVVPNVTLAANTSTPLRFIYDGSRHLLVGTPIGNQ